jgi:hypothetical protein
MKNATMKCNNHKKEDLSRLALRLELEPGVDELTHTDPVKKQAYGLVVVSGYIECGLIWK